ncbi:MAG TPA: AAA family ATPase, partial [Acetobacteraceae bacterium]|nr:AAA family ATPase [Acetobacteraceae bacterium]
MKTLALLSQKGGSGKSTIAVHLAVIAQAAGLRTVLVDLD